MLTVVLCCLLIFFCGFLVYSKKYKHVLLMMLSLEYMVMGVFVMLSFMFFFQNSYLSLVYLVFSTCEGALALSLLVGLSRTYGSDYFLFMNFN